ncbi:hypothetical protein [Nocardioides sp.]|jgi:hypothetical protein|uniref:hypothetical protein n=1 Tax=Nocardioides sp. TaxID=35761 RepID=UPI0026031125|nr:hypothetical protein [Nocardioides sp.]MCW2739321.1 hypothetical protein [Nocardioides sp.]
MPETASSPRVQLDCPAAWHEPVGAALAAAGVVVDPHAAVGVSVAPGRLVSATVDDWSVSSLPHLLVGVWPHAVEIGPWAAPGIGPCARCVAASVLDDGSTLRHVTVPRALMTMAAGVAARDLGMWAHGETPHTWLTSWRVDHEPLPRARRWQRHPYCGCAWFDTA